MKQMEQNNNNNPEQNESHLSIIFRVSGNDPNVLPITIQCIASEKVSTLIQRYKIKSGDKIENKKFIYNAKELNPALTLKESKLTNNAIVHVIDIEHLKGA